jgi:hypothetical protein
MRQRGSDVKIKGWIDVNAGLFPLYSRGFADHRKERINKSGGNDREETTQISENPAKEKSHSDVSCVGR